MAETAKKSKFKQIVTVARIQRAFIAIKNVALMYFYLFLLFASCCMPKILARLNHQYADYAALADFE